MHPRFLNLLRYLDRLSKAVFPGRVYAWLRSEAVRFLVGGRHFTLPQVVTRAFLRPSPIRFIACNGDEFEGDAILDARTIEFPAFAPSKQVKCELVVCCAFTGRHRVLRHAIEESLASNNGQHVRWMLAGSTTEDYLFIKSLATTTGRVAGFLCENRPLGRKWQQCIQLAGRYYDAGLYGITGSDDIISSRLIDHVLGRYHSDIVNGVGKSFLPSLYASMEWLVVVTDGSHPACPQVLRCCYSYDTAFQPLGAGRFYTQTFLEEVHFQIFDGSLERLLDDQGYFEIRNREKFIDYYMIEDGPLVSVKGNWAQLNNVDGIFYAPQLNLREFSFEGYPLLQNSLTDLTFRYLFKPSRIAAQLNFSSPPRGVQKT